MYSDTVNMIGCVILDYIFEHKKLFTILFILIIIKLYIKATTGMCQSKTRMDGKTVIITGANTGIGKETALELARRGARVILACRNMEYGKEAQDDIIEKTGNKNIILHKVDLSSFKSVRKFAQKIIETENRLDVLINNAGVAGFPYKETEDGLDIQIQTNHYGPFLLTILLLGLLKKSAPSRIVVTSSLVHYLSKFEVDKVNNRKPLHEFMAYADSKFVNLLMANELARRLKGTGVTCNSVHPGAVRTDIWRNHFVGVLLFQNIIGLFMKNSIEGAQTSIYLAVAEEIEGVSGKYFADCKEAPTRPAAKNEELARKLWEKSEEVVNLQPLEKLYM